MTALPRYAAVAMAVIAAPVLAHHSFAMFDMNKTVVVTGTIKEIKWSNPHIWIDMMVTTNGQQQLWSVEAGATGTMMRQGWKKDTVKNGDKVTLYLHPLREGANSGSLIKVVLADGRELQLGAQGARPS